MKKRLQNYEKLKKNEQWQTLVEVNNNMYEYAGFLDTDMKCVRNFVVDVLDNTIRIKTIEQLDKAGYQTRCDNINL